MNSEQLRAELEELRSRIEERAERDDLSDDELAAQDADIDAFEAKRDELTKSEQRDAKVAHIREAQRAGRVESGDGPAAFNVVRTVDPFEAAERLNPFSSEAQWREVAIRAVDQNTVMADLNAQTEVERKLRTVKGISRHILATGSETYGRAWAKVATGRPHMLDGAEREALERAMSLTDASGGFLVPVHLDPTILISNAGSNNPFRRISKIVTVTGDNWNGVSSAGVTASWDAEASVVSDDAPTLAQPSITPAKGAAYVPVSIEAYEDIAGLASEIVALFADAKDRLEESGFTTGTGSNQPAGLVFTLPAASVVAAATNSAYSLTDLYSLYEALPARFRRNASFMASLAYVDRTRRFGGSDVYHGFTVDLTAGGIPTLLGKPLYENESMTSGLASVTTSCFIYGDFSNFVIVDRVGLSIEFIPTVFDSTYNRPTGERAWYCHWRVGSDSVVDGAFRLLRIPGL